MSAPHPTAPTRLEPRAPHDPGAAAHGAAASLGARAFVALQHVLPQHGLSRLVYAATRSRNRAFKDALIPVLTDLGRRHTAYGVMKHHYVTVGSALIWTLEQGMGKDFTAEVRDAWCAAYELMAGVMQHGMGVTEAPLAQAA